MRFLALPTLAAGILAAAPALAWNDNMLMTQPALNGNMPVWAYPAQANYCPAGLQPVVVGGVICCGQATHTGYQVHQPSPRRRVQSAPAQPYVSYGKGYNDDGTGNSY